MPNHGRSDELNTAKVAKLVAETSEHTPKVDGEPSLSDVEHDEAILKDE